MLELFSKVEGAEFGPWIVEPTELPPADESLSPAGTEMCLLAGGIGEFPEAACFCGFRLFARLRTFHTTGAVSGQ